MGYGIQNFVHFLQFSENLIIAGSFFHVCIAGDIAWPSAYQLRPTLANNSQPASVIAATCKLRQSITLKCNDLADLIIADPPYGIEMDFGLADNWRNDEEWKAWCLEWLTECRRVLSETGSIMVYAIHSKLCYTQVQLFELGLHYRRQIIWKYENGFCSNRTLRATYEPLLWFSRSNKYHFKAIRDPYKSADRLKYSINKNGKRWVPNPEGRLAGDVWDIPTLAGRRFRDEKVDHPTLKPLVLSERLVRHFAPEGSLVVIPFAGSGSECVAAHRLNRRFVGFEINPTYWDAKLSVENQNLSHHVKF